MKTILVATDFSPASLNAASYAADMAIAIHADLYLLHVYQIIVPYGEIPVLAGAADMEIAEINMTALKKNLIEKKNNLLTIYTEVRTGIFLDEMKAVCEVIKPHMVVMGSQGTTAAERFFLGGHATYALKHMQWPLIMVAPQAKFSSIKKIGLACDFKEVVNTIPVDEIKLLVKEFNAELHVLNTGEKNVFDADLVFESGLFQEMTNELAPHYHFIAGADPDENIMEFAEKNHIDMLIMLPKGHTLIDKLIHRSHTKRLVLHSPIPVMVLHK